MEQAANSLVASLTCRDYCLFNSSLRGLFFLPKRGSRLESKSRAQLRDIVTYNPLSQSNGVGLLGLAGFTYKTLTHVCAGTYDRLLIVEGRNSNPVLMVLTILDRRFESHAHATQMGSIGWQANLATDPIPWTQLLIPFHLSTTHEVARVNHFRHGGGEGASQARGHSKSRPL